jgi:hypothetical protein
VQKDVHAPGVAGADLYRAVRREAKVAWRPEGNPPSRCTVCVFCAAGSARVRGPSVRRPNRYRSPGFGAVGGCPTRAICQRDHLLRLAAYSYTRSTAASARAWVPAPIGGFKRELERRLWPICCGRARIGGPGGGLAWPSVPRPRRRALANL